MAPNVKSLQRGEVLHPAPAPAPASNSNRGHDDENKAAPFSGINIKSWDCKASDKSKRTVNPIRAIVDPILSLNASRSNERDDGKDFINLSVSTIDCLQSIAVVSYPWPFTLVRSKLFIIILYFVSWYANHNFAIRLYTIFNYS